MNPANIRSSISADGSVMIPADAALPAMSEQAVGEDDLSVLGALMEGTAHRIGEEFLQSLVQHLAAAMDAHYAFVTEFLGDQRVRTLAFWSRDRIAPNIEWSLPGTPCEAVIGGNLCHYCSGVFQRFPNDQALVELGIESFTGVPLRDTNGHTLGHLAVFDERPSPAQPRRLYAFRIFAARAAAELQRLRTEQALRESEQRFRDLYEEAPIAYVHEDLETRFVSANRKAIELLGLKPEEVPGFVGKSLVAQTPEAQRRVREAFESIGKGVNTGGLIIELNRKSDGKPIWVQFWSRPEPDGKHTRTMIIDITELVEVKAEKARIEAQNVYLQEEIKSVHNFDEIVGRSQVLLSVLDNVRQVAATDTSVLVTGETGTGKELVARAIHSISHRKDKPLIKVNCAALPAGLVESELFGHERGAFSGAIARRVGRFELAHGGTIFLDEVGEIPLDVQVKLLRVLQEHEFERLGGSATIKADVRVIAATNRDLVKAVREGTFREDLYYRLNVFPIHMPPLRDRGADLPLLVRFMVRKYSARVGKRIDSVDKQTLDRLCRYPWPGNIRELQNVIERAIILSRDSALEVAPELLPAVAIPDAPQTGLPASTVGRDTALQTVEREHILAVLNQSKWVIEGDRGAAKALNMHPNTLRSRMKKLGIVRPTHELS